MKFLCPVDFSESAINGVDYAAHLAKALSASLTLCYVRQSIWPEIHEMEHDILTVQENVVERLVLMRDAVKTEFGVVCDFEIRHTVDTLENVIAEKASDFSLIVMGTNGADTLYQHVFGSNAYNVIKQSRHPILVVPESYRYQTITGLRYAYHPDADPTFQIRQLMQFAQLLRVKVQALHVIPSKPTADTERKMQILRDLIAQRTKENPIVELNYRYSDDVAYTLNEFMGHCPGEILALHGQNRTLADDIFGKKSVIKRVTRVTDYPMLVFWN